MISKVSGPVFSLMYSKYFALDCTFSNPFRANVHIYFNPFVPNAPFLCPPESIRKLYGDGKYLTIVVKLSLSLRCAINIPIKKNIDMK